MADSEDSSLQTLHTTVLCYLRTLQAVAETLDEACPPVGGPYRQRLNSLRTRLAFDSSASAIEESCDLVIQELGDYASRASRYVSSYSTELRRAVAGLEEIVRALAQRQEFYAERLRHAAAQIENPAEAGNLLSSVESMSNESSSLLKKMRDEMARVETRLAEAEITDPVTGLMNRREMERCTEVVQARGESPVLLVFEFRDPLPNEVAQQVGARLGSQFRYNDLISRWSDRRFVVLFDGAPETARLRAELVTPWIAGRYLLDTGATFETVVGARLVDAPLADLQNDLESVPRP